MCRRFALIGKARTQRSRQQTARLRGVVAVVAVGLLGEDDMPDVMVVVIPLRAIFPIGNVGRGSSDTARLSSFSRTRWICRPLCRARTPTARLISFRTEGSPGSGEGMHRVEAKTVKPIVAKPVQRIVDSEGADFRNMIVDRSSPRGLRSQKNCGA